MKITLTGRRSNIDNHTIYLIILLVENAVISEYPSLVMLLNQL